jgi:hypothetical protein
MDEKRKNKEDEKLRLKELEKQDEDRVKREIQELERQQ